MNERKHERNERVCFCRRSIIGDRRGTVDKQLEVFSVPLRDTE